MLRSGIYVDLHSITDNGMDSRRFIPEKYYSNIKNSKEERKQTPHIPRANREGRS